MILCSFANGKARQRSAELPNTNLLVGVHQDEGLGELVLRQQAVELLPRDANAVPVGAVHHVDDGLHNMGRRRRVYGF